MMPRLRRAVSCERSMESMSGFTIRSAIAVRCIKDGRVVKERDDLMSATRYAVMMLRSAKTVDFYDAMDRDIVYPNLGIY